MKINFSDFYKKHSNIFEILFGLISFPLVIAICLFGEVWVENIFPWLLVQMIAFVIKFPLVIVVLVSGVVIEHMERNGHRLNKWIKRVTMIMTIMVAIAYVAWIVYHLLYLIMPGRLQ